MEQTTSKLGILSIALRISIADLGIFMQRSVLMIISADIFHSRRSVNVGKATFHAAARKPPSKVVTNNGARIIDRVHIGSY